MGEGSRLMYMAIDIQNLHRKVIVKLSDDVHNIRAEYEILRKLSMCEGSRHLFPSVYGGGEFMVNNPFDLQQRQLIG